jgi:hypothetical protein
MIFQALLNEGIPNTYAVSRRSFRESLSVAANDTLPASIDGSLSSVGEVYSSLGMLVAWLLVVFSLIHSVSSGLRARQPEPPDYLHP